MVIDSPGLRLAMPPRPSTLRLRERVSRLLWQMLAGWPQAGPPQLRATY